MKRFLVVGILLAVMAPFARAELDFSEAGHIAIQAGGRKKPLDTFASETLLTVSGRKTFRDPKSGERIGAMDALFSMWLGGKDWGNTPVVLVSSAPLKKELGLPLAERLFSANSLIENERLTAMTKTLQSKNSQNDELTPLEKDAEAVLIRIQLLHGVVTGDLLTVVPNPSSPTAKWETLPNSITFYGPEKSAALAGVFKGLLEAYRTRDAAGFSSASRQLRESLAALAPASYPAAGAIEREVHYNTVHPFRLAWILYALSCFMFLLGRGRIAGTVVFATAIGFHVYGMVLRCLIAERPPVTNMYESVIWVTFGVAAFALIFSLIFRARVYLIAAAPLAVLGLILADSFPSVLNPAIAPLPPVLRDNFWLVIHVLTITLSYAAFGLAMGLAHIILGQYLFKSSSIHENAPIHRLLYRVIQIGILLLASGTILGGVWANYSWGRFWGWDPKETWALIALLLYIFSLHGRLVGWWGNFGMAVASAVCFNGVLMAWYGVNFVLGKGLHSYGFGGGGAIWVGCAVLADLIFVAICCVAKSRRSLAPIGPAAVAEESAA